MLHHEVAVLGNNDKAQQSHPEYLAFTEIPGVTYLNFKDCTSIHTFTKIPGNGGVSSCYMWQMYSTPNVDEVAKAGSPVR